MRSDRLPQKALSASAQNLARILIASYFIAAALTLIDGTMGHALARQVVPPEHVALSASAVIFGLAFMVMIAVWLRFAALLLAVVVFWSGFLELLEPAGLQSLDVFWRDLALIGALFLTFAHAGRAARSRSILRRNHPVRKLHPGQETPRQVTSAVNSATPVPPAPEGQPATASTDGFEHAKQLQLPGIPSRTPPRLSVIESGRPDDVLPEATSQKASA